MPSFKRIVASPAFQDAVATAGAWYLRLVWHTSRTDHRAGDDLETAEVPAIIAMWHGQHFMAPFIKKNDGSHRAKVLISRHRDGEINARAAEKLGIGTIRGSGAHNGEFHRKGGAAAFTEMLDALEQGYNVALTADVPKVARVAGLGIIKLAQHSGRPIYAVAMATQPPHRARQLGPQRHQSAVRPDRRWWRASRSMCRPTPTTRRWKPRGRRWRASSTRRPRAPMRSSTQNGSRQP